MTQKIYVYIVVFVSGAVMMSFEIIGSRVLAPNFGNTIFVWGSLISVFLSGLSAGYYLGGKIADREPSHRKLGLIIIIPAFILNVFPLYGTPICNWIFDMDVGDRMGPLVASLLLFLLPSVFLGMVSPYAVRLQTKCLHTAGRTVGNLYALSTVGSIIGTLVTSFYLIAASGVKSIIFCVGLLLLVSALPLLLNKDRICLEGR